MIDFAKVKASKSIFIINRFYGNPPLEERSWIDGNSTASFINHPVGGLFDANCEYVLDGDEGDVKVTVMATVDISPGMELFVPYGVPEDGIISYFNDIKPLQKDVVEAQYEAVFNNGSLSTNLRWSSVQLPEVKKWVIKAENVVEAKVVAKREKAKAARCQKKMNKQVKTVVSADG